MLVKSIFFTINKFISLIGGIINILFSFFPPSPFKLVTNSSFANLISKINYFLPIYEFIVILEAYLVAVAGYYVYSIFARWVKAIE